MLDSIFSFFKSIFQQIVDFLLSVIDWFFDLIQWIPKEFFSVVMDGLGEGLLYAGDMVCVSACVDAVNGIGASLSRVPDIVTYAFPYIHLSTGVELIICAYIVRFVIRRLPIVG